MAFLPGGVTPFQFEWLGIWWALICGITIVSFVIFLLIAIWVYRDAESRGMNGILWLLLLILAGLFFPILGGIIVLIIYLVVRGEHPVGSRPYPYGYAPYPGYATYPPPAAPPQAPAAPPAPAAAPTNCKSCGAPLAANAGFCSNCGTKV